MSNSGTLYDAGGIESQSEEVRDEHIGQRDDKSETPRTLRETVGQVLDNYFEHLDGQPVTGLYELVLCEVEAPLLEAVLKVSHNNQSRCATMLGLNRGTLRKKLKKYGLL